MRTGPGLVVLCLLLSGCGGGDEPKPKAVTGPAKEVADAERLRAAGVAGVYTPKDFDVNKIMGEIVELVGQRAGAGAAA